MNKNFIICSLVILMTFNTLNADTKNETNVVTAEHTDSQWNGKKVAFLGDSITDKKRVGTKKCYWEYLVEMLGIDPYVYARSGRQWNEVYQQAKQTEKEHGDDIDAFVIFAGTNDYNHSVPIGEWYEEVELPVSPVGNPEDKRKCRVPVMNDSTLKGRINIVMDYLKTNYPEKQVIVLTPLHRGFAQFNENNIQYAEGFGNKAGLYIDEYVTAIKEAANVWAVNVIDLNSISGLYPVNDSHAMYFAKKDTDRLHPNEKGHYRMAKVLKYQLMSIPADFK